MKSLKIMGIGLLAAATLFSCKKDEPTPSEPVDATPSAIALQNFISTKLENAKQHFTINATQSSSITGNQGTVINFYPNTIVDASGNLVTGTVDVQLIEIYKKSDIFLLNKQTLGFNGVEYAPLTTGGEFDIRLSQNGNPLFLQEGQMFNVQVQAPNGTDPNMQGFVSSAETSDTLTWTTADSTFIIDSLNYYDTYFNSFGWINCDYFGSYPDPQVPVFIDLPDEFNQNNCQVFISFDGMNSLAGVYQMVNGYFSPGSYYEVPVGQQIHIIAMAIINDEIHRAIVPATVQDGEIIIVSSLTQTDEQTFANELNQLP